MTDFRFTDLNRFSKCCWEAPLIKPIRSADALTCLTCLTRSLSLRSLACVLRMRDLQCWWSNWMPCLGKRRERKKEKTERNTIAFRQRERETIVSVSIPVVLLYSAWTPWGSDGRGWTYGRRGASDDMMLIEQLQNAMLPTIFKESSMQYVKFAFYAHFPAACD